MYFEVMKSVYMPIEHPPLLVAAYQNDKCAMGFATSSLWFLQEGKTAEAIERCDYVIENILPKYDKKDPLGIFTILLAVLRVLKWNGHEGKAYEVYTKFAPAGIESHFAVGALHLPMLSLLKVCNIGSVEQCDGTDDLETDIDLALSCSDKISIMAESIYCADGWSPMSLCAELCLRLASQLKPGNALRDDLVDKGVQLSTITSKMAKSSNGMVKHILAFEANSKVHAELLELAKENVAFDRHVVHCNASSQETHAKSISTHGEFSQRLVVNDSLSSGSSPNPATFSLKGTHIHVESKKVSFAGASSLGGSLGLPGSKNSHGSVSVDAS